jgi:serine/threonine protein kinase
MTMPGSFGTDDLPHEVLWQGGERVYCTTWRLGANGRQESMAVRSAAVRPAPDIVSRLTHEHELKDYIDSEWAVRPLELVHERGQTVLVLESAGGLPLDRLVAPAMDVGKFLRLAINLSVALGRLHERGLVHKDIKPANILVSPGRLAQRSLRARRHLLRDALGSASIRCKPGIVSA